MGFEGSVKIHFNYDEEVIEIFRHDDDTPDLSIDLPRACLAGAVYREGHGTLDRESAGAVFGMKPDSYYGADRFFAGLVVATIHTPRTTRRHTTRKLTAKAGKTKYNGGTK